MDMDPTRELSTRIAAAFAEIGFQAIPAIDSYLQNASVPREVSYGCRVRFWRDKDDNLRAQLIPAQPKLPTVDLEKVEFTLTWENGQLAFDYDGMPQPPAEAGTEDPPPAPTPPAPPTPPTPPLPPAAGDPGANGAQAPAPIVCEAEQTEGNHAWQPTREDGVFVCSSCNQRGKLPINLQGAPAE